MRAPHISAQLEFETRVKNSRILIADDLIASVSLFENVLNRLGYKQIRTLTSTREVLTTVKSWNPDIIVLDLGMSDGDAFALLESLRLSIPKEEWTPVVVTSVTADATMKRKAFAAGASEFLSKPIDSAEFVLRIRNLLLMRIYNAALRDQNQILEDHITQRTKALAERTVELERALTELTTAQNRMLQQERFAAFAEMAGGIAHDFNNVLQCVIGYTDLMIQNPRILEEKHTVQDFLQTMNTAGLDASRLVGRLRDFYRPREDSDAFERVDLNALIKAVIPLTQPKWQAQALAKGRVIDVTLELSEIPFISGDPSEIRELLINLVFNAVDAMPEGGRLRFRTGRGENTARIGVSDSGIGMTEDVQQRCMEPFFSTKGEEGTGLGLAMVFGIVKRHDAIIQIESVPGAGTTFWIDFPIAENNEASCAEAHSGICQPLKILVADDDPIPRDILVRYLRSDNHEVIAVGGGREALSRVGREKFDLIITDQAMPHITGAQLASAIHLIDPKVPVVLLTGFDQATIPRNHPEAIREVVKKPVSQRMLRQIVTRIFEASSSDALSSDGPRNVVPLALAPA
jgi:signal transduction histidine kinase